MSSNCTLHHLWLVTVTCTERKSTPMITSACATALARLNSTKQSSSGSVDLHGAHFRGWKKYAGTYPARMSTMVLIFADGAQIRARICAPGARFRGGNEYAVTPAALQARTQGGGGGSDEPPPPPPAHDEGPLFFFFVPVAKPRKGRWPVYVKPPRFSQRNGSNSKTHNQKKQTTNVCFEWEMCGNRRASNELSPTLHCGTLYFKPTPPQEICLLSFMHWVRSFVEDSVPGEESC